MKPKFIIVTGIDGVGKTTLVMWLVEYLKSKGYRSKYVWIRYQHTLAFILSRILIKMGYKRTFKNPNGHVISRFEIPEGFFSKQIWPIIEFISILPLIIIKVKIPLLLNYKVVCDRYTIDTIVSVALNTKNVDFPDSLLGKILLKMIPNEGTIFFLNADPNTVLRRRPDIEYSINEIKNGIQLYELLSKRMNAVFIDVNSQKIEDVRENVSKLLNSKSIIQLSKNHDKEQLDFSIVIPTCNRPSRLKSLLSSILLQRKYPREVIVVDQSDTKTTSNLIKNIVHEFSIRNISLTYIYIQEKNASRARNLGVEKSKGEITFLIDDDVTLNRDYTEKILNVYLSYPDAVGVQGLILTPQLLSRSERHLENLMKKVFFLSYYQKNTWKVMPSVNDIFPFPLTKIIKSPRLQGICSYKRDILNKYKYDENLEGWSFLEDFDISYRIHKSKVGSLYITPEAKLIHKEHKHMESSKKIEIYKKIVNRTYIFFKLFNKTYINYLIFVWSLIGYILTTVIGTILGRRKEQTRMTPIYMIEAVIFTLNYLNEIKRLNMKFLNSIMID